MQFLDLAGRVVVAGALAWAALAKLADLAGLRATLYLSRLTRRWVPQLSAVLPAVELALAVGLPTVTTAWWVTLAATVLLVAFTAFLALDPHAGEGCNCFGRRSSSSRRAGIVRDVLLVVALLPALLRGPTAGRAGAGGVLEPWWLGVGAALTVLVVVWRLRADRRSRGRRRAGLPQVAVPPPPRRPAPPFAVLSLGGVPIAPDPGHLLVFVEPGCSACAAVLDHLRDRPDVRVLVGVRTGEEQDVATLAVRHGLVAGVVAPDVEGVVADAYGVRATPSTVRVDAEGTVPLTPVAGAEAILRELPAPGPRPRP